MRECVTIFVGVFKEGKKKKISSLEENRRLISGPFFLLTYLSVTLNLTNFTLKVQPIWLSFVSGSLKTERTNSASIKSHLHFKI